MKKKLLILFVLFFMTGCWNYKELNAIAITTAMGIDLTDTGEYEVSLLIANSKKSQVSSKEGEAQSIVYSGVGKTISEALKKIDLKNPRYPYIGHLSIIVVSEDIAKEGLLDILELMLRDTESIKRFFLAIAKKDKAKDIIAILSPLATFPAQNIATNIKISNESQAISSAITYSKFIEEFLKQGSNPILPTLSILGDEKKGTEGDNLQNSIPKASVKLDTLGLFKKDKLLGYASEDESRGINLLLGNITEMIIVSEEKNCKIIAQLSESNTKTSVKNKKNPYIEVSFKAMATLKETNCNLDLEDPKTMKKIEKAVSEKTKSLMEKGLKVAKEKYKTDIFGYGNLIYKKNPSYFKKVKKDWDKKGFQDLDVKIKTTIGIKANGSLNKTLKEASNEKK